MVQRSAVTMHLTSPQSHGFLRRIRSHISEASTGWESHDLSSNFKSTDPSVSTFDLNQFYSAVKSGNKEKVKEILDQHPEILESKDVHQNNTALHLAVINNNADMVQILARRSKNLEAKDSDGNTALHLAAAGNDATITNSLLSFGADPRAINEAGDTVVHFAVRCGSADVLQILLKCPLVDVNLPGWNQETPLHVAASHNEVQCAKLLISHKADITARCSSGAQPIHYTASFGALDVLRYILQISSISIGDLLRSIDNEEATPLHLAVNRGDREISRLLLEAGAPIASQMFELSTPLHIACALGTVDIVDMMYSFNVVEFERVLHMVDAQGMTPVHRAAMFNHWTLLRSLIEKRAFLNARDASGRTVLVLAASRGSWDAVSELLTCNADSQICSNDGQNFLHYVVALGGDPEVFRDEIRQAGIFAAIIDGKDNAGDTPLHYAARCGFGSCCDTLVKLGALITAKSKELKTPLHLAAEFGRYSTMKKLLMCAEGQSVVNEIDSKGRTPLHLAAKNGHLKIVLLLMSKGSLMARDLDGSLPLHLACSEDQKDVVQILVSNQTHLLNAVDKKGNTPFHVAAENNAARSVAILLRSGARSLTNNENLTALDLAIMQGHQEVAKAVVESERWEELMLQPSSLYAWPSHGLIQEFPDIMLKVLDKCQVPSSEDPLSKEYYVKYDYRILQPDLNWNKREKDQINRKPLEALNHMTHWKRVELLSHPVCTTYLEAKWRTYGLFFHIITLTLYVTFLILLTYLVLTGIEFDLRPHMRQLSIENIRKYKPELLVNATRIGPVELILPEGEVTVGDRTLLAFAISFALIHLLKKVMQLRREGMTYFIRLITLFELTLYVSTMLFCIGFFDEENYYMSWQTQWLLGAVSIFFAWTNFFFFLKRYGEVGMHVMILLRTMKMLTEAMVVLFVVVVAFAITFFTLNPAKILPNDPNFYQRNHDGDAMMDIYWTSYSTLQTAILRVSDQMIGDADVIVNFIDPILGGLMIFPTITYILAMISIAVVTILLQSLIIGLTVGEIRYLRETVTLRRKAMQVDLHTEIEEKIPQRIMASWDIAAENLIFPNRIKSRFLKDVLKYFSASAEEGGKDDALDIQNAAKQTPLKAEEVNEENLGLADLSAKADQQHELLRMIIQDMNIQIESDVFEDKDGEARRKKLSRFVDSKMADIQRGKAEEG